MSTVLPDRGYLDNPGLFTIMGQRLEALRRIQETGIRLSINGLQGIMRLLQDSDRGVVMVDSVHIDSDGNTGDLRNQVGLGGRRYDNTDPVWAANLEPKLRCHHCQAICWGVGDARQRYPMPAEVLNCIPGRGGTYPYNQMSYAMTPCGCKVNDDIAGRYMREITRRLSGHPPHPVHLAAQLDIRRRDLVLNQLAGIKESLADVGRVPLAIYPDHVHRGLFYALACLCDTVFCWYHPEIQEGGLATWPTEVLTWARENNLHGLTPLQPLGLGDSQLSSTVSGLPASAWDHGVAGYGPDYPMPTNFRPNQSPPPRPTQIVRTMAQPRPGIPPGLTTAQPLPGEPRLTTTSSTTPPRDFSRKPRHVRRPPAAE